MSIVFLSLKTNMLSIKSFLKSGSSRMVPHLNFIRDKNNDMIIRVKHPFKVKDKDVRVKEESQGKVYMLFT